MTHSDPILLARLRDQIWALEQGSGMAPLAVPIGAPDGVLPWGGLPLARLHQIAATDGAGLGFAAGLLGLLARRQPVLWCRRRTSEGPYLPGLAAFGLTPDRVLMVEADRAREVLWVMEEGLRCAGLGAVLGEIDDLPPAAVRRLQLAAEAGGVAGLVVTPARIATAGATTRWKIAAAPSAPPPWGGLGAPAWRVALERCRGALPHVWVLEWRDGRFALPAAALAATPAAAPAQAA